VAGLQTEFEFFLPKGFVDDAGTVHREGTMRLATARDELDPLRDPRVRDADDPFLTIIVLSRVVTRLGALSQVTPREIEGLFAADLAYLQDVYGAVNFGGDDDIADVVEDALDRKRIAAEMARRGRDTPAARPDASSHRFDGGDDDGADDADDDDTIDADALAAQLQAAFGETAEDDGDDREIEVPSRRRHIEEVGSRVG
jgi:hypothetical protein